MAAIALKSLDKKDWGTPQDFFDKLNAEFNFDLDAAANDANAKCQNYFTEKENALGKSWKGYKSIFINPPYGREVKNWVAKASAEHAAHGMTIVMLLKATTDTAWFHDYVYNKAEIRFVRGRLTFEGGKGDPALFSSIVVIFRGKTPAKKDNPTKKKSKIPQTKLNVLDLFSGIGGFSLGLEKTGGFETVAFCEIEPYPQKVLKKHWPSVHIYNDVRELTGEEARKRCATGTVDVICGGFPCTDISSAGKQAGIEGKQSGLWKEYKRLIKEIRPKYAIIENVANLRAKGLVTVLQDLWEVGYGAEWHIIPAADVGAPHKRERIWIISYPSKDKLRVQSGWSTGENGEKTTIIGNNGKEKFVANSTGSGLSDGGGASVGQSQTKSKSKRQDSQGGGVQTESIPNPQIEQQTSGDVRGDRGLSENRGIVQSWLDNLGRKEIHASGKWWEVEPGLGREIDGISKGLDRFGINVWGPDWEDDVSRTTEKSKNRVGRLKGLGNSVVPQIPFLLGMAILHNERDNA